MLLVPEVLWDELIRTFQATRRRVEQVAYLDGLETQDLSIVTTVAFPNGILRAYSYRVPPEAMSEAGKHLRKWGLVRLAQVHTHPGVDVDHSPEDDRRAYSQEAGAVSIVLPNYGRGDLSLRNIGFHLREPGGWARLGELDILNRLSFVPSEFDFRKGA